jgi:hypothetical protein
MYVRVIHSSGKPILVTASEVVIYADDGTPVAITYEREKMLVHTDRNQSDFESTASSLAIGELKL